MSNSKIPFQISYNWSVGGQNCLAFCYPNDNKPFAIRGRRDLVIKHVENIGQSIPLIAHFLPYGSDKSSVPNIVAFGFRNNITVSFVHADRRNPGTKMLERHRRNWVVVHKYSSDGVFVDNIIYVKRFRQFPRSWIQELDPFVKGAKVKVPLIHDGIKQDEIKQDEIKQDEIKQDKEIYISYNKSTINPIYNIHNVQDLNAFVDFTEEIYYRNEKYLIDVSRKDKLIDLTLTLKKAEAEAARIKAEAETEAEAEAKALVIRKYREQMLKRLRKMGVIPGHKGERLDVYEVEESS